MKTLRHAFNLQPGLTFNTVMMLLALLVPATVSAQKAPPESIRIYQLKHAEAGQVADVLSQAVQDHVVRIAVDPRTNAVIVAAGDQVQQMVGSLLEQLDVAQTTKEKKATDRPFAVQARLVWLVSGQVGGLQAPSSDLAPVVEELKQLGVDDVRVVANTVVNSLEGNFQLECSPELGRPIRLSVEGTVRRGTSEAPIAEMRIRARGGARQVEQQGNEVIEVEVPPRSQDLVSLSTSIEAPFGQFIVLGAAPIGQTTSVFVVQFTPR